MKLVPITIALATAALFCAPSAWARGSSHHSSSSGTSSSSSSGGTHYVQGHTDKNGKYIQGHRQTNPNDTKRDNWSSKGNVNPDTGKAGTKDPNK